MAAFQNFRSAFNGFNREDVVHYIEFVNNNHNAQVNQLNTELQVLRSEVASLRGYASQVVQLNAQLQEANTLNEALQQELDELYAQMDQAATRPQTESELEAYRRAERTERIARERVAQLYSQVNGILADATVRADDAVTQIDGLTEQVCSQLAQLQAALINGADTIRDSAAAMYTIKPFLPEEE